MSSFLFSLISLIFSLLFFISSAIASLSLSLHQFNGNPSQDQRQKLALLASSSLIRAQHLKNPQTAPKLSTTPLYPHAYGGYSISLNFGTPPQTISVLMDTGSDLVWFPCTQRYLCSNCSLPNPNEKIQIFIPKLSSSAKLIGCKNPKCSWIHGPDLASKCQNCPTDSRNCSQICPPYIVIYGSGSTGGVLLSETLTFPTRIVPDFTVGCSIFSNRQPAGIAGFGRGLKSLPSQLALKRFSYCLLSHKFDDDGKSSTLVLDGASDSGQKNISYTPFLKNPVVAAKSAYSVYYYVGLRKITVGGKRVKIPYKFFSPDSDGNGGTVVDSGTTFTFMEGQVFELVATAFVTEMGTKYKRATDVESVSGLRPCFDISGKKSVTSPELVLHFKGGAQMELPLANYFSFLGDSGIICLTVITDGFTGQGFSGGPSIILGNFQQQNFYVEYDLEREKFGFRKQTC